MAAVLVLVAEGLLVVVCVAAAFTIAILAIGFFAAAIASIFDGD